MSKTDEVKPRATAREVSSDVDMLLTEDQVQSAIVTAGLAPKGFNSAKYTASWIRKKDIDKIRQWERLLEEGDPNHPDIDPREFLSFNGKRVIMRSDVVCIYALTVNVKKITQAQVDESVGMKTRMFRPGRINNTAQKLELAEPDSEGLGPVEVNVQQKSALRVENKSS